MSKITSRINDIKLVINPANLAPLAYKEFVRNTPVDTGNARKHTLNVGNEIRAEYPYAVRLENGYSKQSPRGMVIPTLEWIRKHIANKLGK